MVVSLHHYLYLCLTFLLRSSSYSSSCRLREHFNLSGMHLEGDVVLGGLFEVHFYSTYPDLSFTTKPQQLVCEGFDVAGFRQAQTMAFTIEEINKNPHLLPNVTLGYHLYDNCLQLGVAFRAALSLASGTEDEFLLDKDCRGSPPVMGVVGDPGSTHSIAVSSVLGLFRVPMVSYYATCSCLSDRQAYPSFFRTIPSDAFQVRAMLQILRRFGWTWVGLLVSDDDYGRHAAHSFLQGLAHDSAGCPAYHEVLPGHSAPDEYRRIVSVVRASTARVVVVFSNQGYMLPLLDEVWQFWEEVFGCRFEHAGLGVPVCSGQEALAPQAQLYLDVSDLRAEYNIYKAVYTLAHALHSLLRCVPGQGPFPGRSCARMDSMEPWQLVYYLERVNFTTGFGDRVLFDENGDALPIYDIMNWAWLPDGSVKVQNVGAVDESLPVGEQLILHEDKIFWNFKDKKPPKSVCSESCPPGTRLANRKGQPVCCFDCIPCSDGEVSNHTDSTECSACPEDYWSDPQRTQCIPKTEEFLSYSEPLGMSLAAISLLGAVLTAVVMAIFVRHRNTPVVRANNSELSFLVLLSLKLCFLCSLLFIGQPKLWACQLRHAAFGISFVLCVSCILVKTVVVLGVFRASKPGGETIMKWFGARHQRGTVLALTSVQTAICTGWLLLASPTPHKNTRYQSDTIVYECVVGSVAGFAALLGYIALLAVLSFLLAFLARNLPDNFNEAKLITFSMLIFCAVWVAFVPAYISSPGKYADVVEIFAILASSYGLLLALFGPKCYIILLRPERNTKKAIMGRAAPKT
ncbi:extracellular calcium-sensing receptor-like [Osmerus eperlanus]|uniref:extracellular calcium-sensing receptor-like n=1 Tax=Osmerus eperlanus TaxID=29151 RepID=UPI002E0D563B